MEAHFIDNRGDQKVFWLRDIPAIPRLGDLVFLCYNDDGDSGAWRVVEVDWSFFIECPGDEMYVDILCEPYNEGDWLDSADAMLASEQAYAQHPTEHLLREEP